MTDQNIEYHITPKNKWSIGLKELSDYRELLLFFAWRDIKVKYKQSLIGVGWVVLQPVIMMSIFTFIFGNKMGLSKSVTEMPYSVFVLSGLIFWFVFASGLAGSGNSMVSNAGIIKKVYFPRLIIPISAILVSMFDFIMSFLVLLALIAYYHIKGEMDPDYLSILIYTPLCLGLTILATSGLGLLTSALNVKYRDFKYIIPFLIQILLFVTPVIYPISIISDNWTLRLLSINPMYAPISLIKSAFGAGDLDITGVLISLISSIIFFVLGLYYFRKTEHYFADIA